MSAHTRGPWHIAPNPDPKATHPDAHNFAINRFRFIATEPTVWDEASDEPCGEIVCKMMDGPNLERDARLISAAPDLLAALERLIAAYQSDVERMPGMTVIQSWETNGIAIEQVRTAIAKAKGEA